MARRVRDASMRTGNLLVRSLVLVVFGGLISGLLIFGIDFFLGLFTGIGDFGITLTSTIVSLFVFVWAIGMSRKKKFGFVDLAPILIVAPLATAILGTLGLTVFVTGGTEQFLTNLGITLSGLFLADSFAKQMGLLK